MPVIIIEGLYYGKILLVSQYTNPYSVITNEHNGFIFDIDKDNDLVNCLKHISNLSKQQKNKIERQAKLSSAQYNSEESSKLYYQFLFNKN